MLTVTNSPAKGRQYRLKDISQRHPINVALSAKKGVAVNLLGISSYSQSKHRATEPL